MLCHSAALNAQKATRLLTARRSARTTFVYTMNVRGQVLFAFSLGAGTPIYVPAERLRAELERRGFMDFAEFTAGEGTAVLARKAAPA